MSTRDFDEFDEFEQDLVELEQASAILHQRDPIQAAEVVAAVRAKKLEEQRRLDRVEAARAIALKRRRVRRIRLAIVASVVAVAGIVAVPMVRAVLTEAERATKLQKALSVAGEVVASRGMKQEKDWLDVPPAGLVFEVPRNSCTAVVSASEGTEPLRLRLERKPGTSVDAAAALLWCSCEKEEARVRFIDAPERRLALRMYSSAMSAVGGVEALAAEPPSGIGVVGAMEALPCADAAFAVWSRSGAHGQLDAFKPGDVDKARTVLDDNLEPAGVFRSDRMFGVVRCRAGECYLALPLTGASGLALRDPEGLRLTEGTKSAVAWCAYAGDRPYALWRKQRGSGDVHVFRAPATRVGGLTGMRELGLRASRSGVEDFLPDGSLTDDAAAALVGSGVGDKEVIRAGETGLPGDAESRVVAFSLKKGGAYLPDVAPRIPTGCVPDPPVHLPLRTFVCVQERAQRWRAEGAEDVRGAAEAKLPFWLSLFAGISDRGALEAAARMLAFSRRMTLLGFEPTTVEGVKDTPFGVQINGRPDHPHNVAVGLTARPPWIHPLTDGAAWKLEGDLRVVDVGAGKSKQLRALGGLGQDASARRVVVWRK
ncbi:MAG: hypothetical protein MUF54_05770 [Polyangiaceae bacterium]|nr:hypothetical protein [Polyangiaceae bacterium]